MSYNDLIGDVPPIIQEEYGEEETVAEFSAWEQDLKSVELEFLKTGKSGKSDNDKPGVLITNSGNYKYQLDRGSIRSSPRYSLSTPYRLTIRNSARLFHLHHVLFNMNHSEPFLLFEFFCVSFMLKSYRVGWGGWPIRLVFGFWF